MNKQLLLCVFAVALVLAGCSTMKSDNMMKDPAPMSGTMMKDGVFNKDGKIMETMNGKTTDLMMDVTLKDGTKIMTDGTVVMKDGSKAMLMNGEMYDFDGMKTMVETPMAK